MEGVPEGASPAQLAGELAGMMRTGVTVNACRRSPGLLGLSSVRAKAASDGADDRAVAARNLVREACARVDDVQSGNTAVLLGVAPGFIGVPTKTRRQHVADDLVITADHVRSYREPQMLEAVADELYAMDSAYRLRHRHRTQIEENPTKSALAIDWLAQHRSYRRIWTPVTALRADTLTLASYLRELQGAGLLPRTTDALEEHGGDSPLLAGPDNWHRISERAMNLCWRLAQFGWELARFVEREGGLWLLADAESELRAADAMYRLQVHLPWGEADESVLRLMLTSAREREFDPFEDLMLADQRWPIFRDGWLRWAQTYVDSDGGGTGPTTNVRVPDSGPSGITRVTDRGEQSACGLWLAAGEDFIQLIDADWYRVADWYRS